MAAHSGNTYFHRPAVRGSDGRLIIDLIAEHLELPFLSPYLDSIGTNFQHGANFVTEGATIWLQNKSWLSPLPLDIQVEHYTQFKELTAYFYNQESDNNRLPRPKDILKALYTFDLGQNDIAAGFRTMSNKELRATIPDIVNQFAKQIRDRYLKGARVFRIHNTGPIGCLHVPTTTVQNPQPGYLDKHGCVNSQYDMARKFNKQLKNQSSNSGQSFQKPH